MRYIQTYMIERASELIYNLKYNVKNDTETISIRKNGFLATEKEPYYEDYCVLFVLLFEGNLYSSTFYLQWYDDTLDSPNTLSIKKTNIKKRSYT